MSRSKRHQRLDPPPAMRLTPRDLDVIACVYQYRLLTQSHIYHLCFTNLNPNVCNRRLYLLYHNAYLERQFLLNQGGVMNSPILYLLAKRGAQALEEAGYYPDLTWQPHHNQIKDLHLNHLLKTNEFRVEITLACRQLKLEITTWLDDYTLHADYDRVYLAGQSGSVSIIPDGYFQIKLPEADQILHFFLELDNNTMEVKRYKQKMLKYRAWEQSGLLYKRFQTRGYRVLTVTTDPARALRLKQVAEEAQVGHKFWFGVLDQLTADRILTHPLWYIARRNEPASLINSGQLIHPL